MEPRPVKACPSANHHRFFTLLSPSSDPAAAPLPWVLAGPILRQCTPTRWVCWLAVREPVRLRIGLQPGTEAPHEYLLEPGGPGCTLITAGQHLHYLLIDLALSPALSPDVWVGYRMALQPLAPLETGAESDQPGPPHLTEASWIEHTEWAPNLCHPGQASPGLVLPSRVRSLLHGSCRKPHHPAGDGLAEADALLGTLLAGEGASAPQALPLEAQPEWPSMLVMTGDQIYTDDVAGPLLHAIHQVVALLGLPDEALPEGALPGVGTAQALYQHPAGFYRRETLLPRHARQAEPPQKFALNDLLFGGVEKPVFTTDSAHNHLITLGEVLAMYLLVWSPELWRFVDLSPPPGLDPALRTRYDQERTALENFVQGLPAARRVMAHLPTAMIFDDHDITDDWNISREWEEVAYGHPLSRRVIGNALLGYCIHQGWGNRPEVFTEPLLAAVQDSLHAPGQAAHDHAIMQLLGFGQWHYTWPTEPPLVVLDCRTHRWRSESAARKPSGLMDWEALTDLQQTLKGLPAVLLVSPSPIIGVKLIETLQRVFTWLGHPLMVDAENWMAHPGAGHGILNILRHPRTPQHFVVLSGDVHYSFVYDVELRTRGRGRGRVAVRGPHIWQICSSGLRNAFPPRLLDTLDVANRWLYSPRSPLNWFTRRRHMRVIPRKPEGIAHGRRLLNGSGVGLVELDAQGVPWRIRELTEGGRVVGFTRREDESRWD